MDVKTANEIYTILVEECGATDSDYQRSTFIQSMVDEDMTWSEYRFMGALGFGGKFYHTLRDARWYVSCYHEDRTPERRAMIDLANERLDDLREQVSATP